MRSSQTTRLANVRRYAYLDTRVAGMAGHLLGTRELDDLLDHPLEPESLRRMIGLDGSAAERGIPPSGQAMTSALLHDLAVLVRAVTGPERDFLVYWARRFELRNLKTLIRGKMAKLSSEALRGELVDMGPFATLPVDQLLETSDVAELLRRLERTPHADVARQAREIHDERHELFAIDAAVDKRYYTELWERAARIDPRHAPLFHELLGTRTDRVNLVWMLRYRFEYELPPIQTYYLLVPFGLRLNARALQTLTQLASFADVIRNLPEPLRSDLKKAANAFDVTLVMEENTRRVARAGLRTRFSFTPAFAYLLLRERDLRRVRAVLEGRRLSIPPPAIRESLGLDGDR